MKLLVAIGLLAGCDRILGLEKIDPPRPDAGTGDTDALSPVCLGLGMISHLCAPGNLVAKVELGTDIDTDMCAAQSGGIDSTDPRACIVWGASIHGGDVIAHGSLPLVLAATQVITLDGVLDVGAHGTAVSAPGATTCSMPATMGIMNSLGAGGGGGGGGYHGRGGSGGNAASNGTGGFGAQSATIGLHGGCGGANGGPSPPGPTAFGGGGGGAVYLTSKHIVITAAIVAGGGGGDGGGTEPNGGGGGGGGGLIALDAPSIDLSPTGRLCANGGGGGGGGSKNAAAGMAGTDACGTNAAASGGAADGTAGAGGTGSSVTLNGAAGTASDPNNGAAGGGGGGAGHIVFYDQHPASANISPPAD